MAYQVVQFVNLPRQFTQADTMFPVLLKLPHTNGAMMFVPIEYPAEEFALVETLMREQWDDVAFLLVEGVPEAQRTWREGE